MTEQEAINLSENARSSSRLVNLWMEHPWVAHDLHERAASAWEKLVGNDRNSDRFKRYIKEHHAAAQYFAGLEANWNSLMGYNQKDNCSKQPEEQPYDATKLALGIIAGIK